MIREAKLADVETIHSMIEYYHEINPCFLYRNKEEIKQNIKNFLVVEENKEIIGCGEIRTSSVPNSSEIRAFCIKENYYGKGYGSKLIKHLISKAKTNKIFAVTTSDNSFFFEKNGFVKVGTLNEIISKKKQTEYYKEVLTYPSFCDKIPGDCAGILLELLK